MNRVSAATPEHDAFVVLAIGEGVSQELCDDITEAVSFAVGRDKSLNFLPKEEVQASIGYSGPDKTGSCLFDNECLRKSHLKLKTRWFTIARLTREKAGYQLVVSRIGASAGGDLTASATVPKSTSEVINKARALLNEVLREPMATLVVSVNVANASVRVDGKLVGKGSQRLPVTPGTHRIDVDRKGYISFSTHARCKADTQCVVTANLVQQNVISGPVVTSRRSGINHRLWKILGWSSTGLGLGLVVTSIVTGIEVVKIEDELIDSCGNPVGQPCSLSKTQANSRSDRAESMALTANITGILGGVLVAGGATALIWEFLARPEHRPSAVGMNILPVFQSDGTLGLSATMMF